MIHRERCMWFSVWFRILCLGPHDYSNAGSQNFVTNNDRPVRANQEKGSKSNESKSGITQQRKENEKPFASLTKWSDKT